MFIALSKIRAMEHLPYPVLLGLIDATYALDGIAGITLEAAFKAPSIARKRGEWVSVPVSTGETVQACIIGQFVKVEF
ncbi:hypothetical protein D3C87_1267860 [compost metagenome]